MALRYPRCATYSWPLFEGGPSHVADRAIGLAGAARHGLAPLWVIPGISGHLACRLAVIGVPDVMDGAYTNPDHRLARSSGGDGHRTGRWGPPSRSLPPAGKRPALLARRPTGSAGIRTASEPRAAWRARSGTRCGTASSARSTFRELTRPFWHRASFDGHGEKSDGSQWEPTDTGSGLTHGRGWPLLTGERGEYQLAADAGAQSILATMARTADNASWLLPEQVWDHRSPAGSGPRFRPGEPTFSATPLAWTHAQFIRLAWSIVRGAPVETPQPVACRYHSPLCRKA